MIDAVDSGGFGVLGLYAARAPVVPEPPDSPPVTSSAAEPAGTTQDAASALGQGSGPLPAAEPGADGSATPGRDFGDSAQGQARQTAVLTALVATSGAARNGAAAASLAASPQTAPATRALRAYGRAGTSVPAGSASGIMVARRT